MTSEEAKLIAEILGEEPPLEDPPQDSALDSGQTPSAENTDSDPIDIELSLYAAASV
ncbi:MAG TPA: hypothetical protein VLT57_12780 [Bryobacteraceae bacterium]|nr:hypothetical protein [Bryobacteraceae bacterium]